VTRSLAPVIVVGSGWAGLAAAVELSRNGIPVTVLESAKQMGGRARRVLFPVNSIADNTLRAEDAIGVDNGQHLLVGAYDSTLSLLHTIGVSETTALKRIQLSLSLLDRRGKLVRVKTPRIPAPFHLIYGLLRARGLSVYERMAALRFLSALSKIGFSPDRDESCESLFKRHRVPLRVTEVLWEPLCLIGLNTPIREASAQVFLRIMRESLAHGRKESNLLLTCTDLSAIFPDPAMDYIERKGGSIQLGQKVSEININNQGVTGVSLPEQKLKSHHVILATPYQITADLCAKHPQLSSLTQQLQRLHSNPICTVYLQYPSDTTVGREMLGMLGTTSQWVFDRKLCGQAGLMAVVINGDGEHMKWSNDKLTGTVKKELAERFPRWPEAQHAIVIREKRATFHCAVNINQHRPQNQTGVKGLWIAGDYTNTGLPATLESAVRSGIRSARAAIDSIRQNA
jgi:squalene-associated FAD-dependent desaturase